MMKRAGSIGLIIVLLGVYTWAEWQFFTRSVPGGNDFIAHLTTWEAYLKQGLNPYSDEAALYTQHIIYGRPAKPTEDQNRLTYPFYSILLHGPFVLIGDYALARAIYMTLLQVALFVGVIWSMRVINWRPPFWLTAIVLAWSLLFYPEARGVILGQFAIFGFFSLAGALYLLRRRRDDVAGALLVLATVKPTLVFLVVPFLLVWAITQRRWQFIIGFGATWALAMLVSWLMLPSWLSDWFYRMTRYSDYTVGQSPVWLLTHQALPSLGDTGEMILVALLLAAMLYSWWVTIRSGGDAHLLWSLGVTLVVSNLIVSRSATTNYVMLLLPALWLFAVFDGLPKSQTLRKSVIVIVMLVSFVGLWWLHAATVVGNQEQPIMFIPVPVVLGLMLILFRPHSASRRAIVQQSAQRITR